MRFLISLILMLVAYCYGGFVYLSVYLSGAIPFAWIIGKIVKGIDIRYIGSGNIGTTAIERALGKGWSRVVMILDMFKCAVPMWIAIAYHFKPEQIINIAIFAVLGHCFSIFMKGRGGKGAGSGLGAVLALEPFCALITFVSWVFMRKLTKIVSASTIVASLTVILLQWIWIWPMPSLVYRQSLTKIALLIILMHIPNMIRMIKGTERHIGDPEPEVIPWLNFIVHATSDDPEHTKRRFLDKIHNPWLYDRVKNVSADWCHNWLRPRLPILRYAIITGVQSLENGNIANMVIYSLPDTAAELANNPRKAARKIYQAILKGVVRYGAKLAGLGAHTSIVAGEIIPKMLEKIIPVTSGNSLTVYFAMIAALLLSKFAGKDPAESTAVVIGAYGSIGKPCVQMLVKAGFNTVIMVGRDSEKLKDTIKELGSPGLEWTTDIQDALGKADVIISATSAKSELNIDPKWIKAGAVGSDVSRPRSFGEAVESRTDLLIVAGGLVKLPGKIVSSFKMDISDDEVPGCMAECFALGLERRFESYSAKELSLAQILEIGQIAEKHGLRLGSLRSCTDKSISQEQLVQFLRSQNVSESEIGSRITSLYTEMRKGRVELK